MESYGQNTCLHRAHCLHFPGTMVRRRALNLPSLPHHYKPGKLLITALDPLRFHGWFFNMVLSSLQTTYENFRYQYSRRANPYNRGIVGNIMDIFCSSIPKSKNDFRAKVQKKQPMIPSHSVGDSFDSTTLAVSKRLQGKSIWDETNDKALAIGSNRVTLSSNGESVTEYQQYL